MKSNAQRLSLRGLLAGVAITAWSGLLWASLNPPSINATEIRQCYEKLSSDFHIHEKVGNGVAARISNGLVNKIESLLETASDPNFSHDQGLIKNFLEDRKDFDQLQETIDHNQEEWTLDTKSDQILDDCYVALHPNEKQ